MNELFDLAVPWKTLLFMLLLFGFAPGFCLRLLVLMYPREDPRRTELIAELYAISRHERPLWVAEQMEVALFEGVAQRLRAQDRRERRRYPVYSVRFAATAAVLFIAFSGVGLVAKGSVQSHDPRSGLTKVLYSDYARSVETSQTVPVELEKIKLEPDNMNIEMEQATPQVAHR